MNESIPRGKAVMRNAMSAGCARCDPAAVALRLQRDPGVNLAGVVRGDMNNDNPLLALKALAQHG